MSTHEQFTSPGVFFCRRSQAGSRRRCQLRRRQRPRACSAALRRQLELAASRAPASWSVQTDVARTQRRIVQSLHGTQASSQAQQLLQVPTAMDTTGLGSMVAAFGQAAGSAGELSPLTWSPCRYPICSSWPQGIQTFFDSLLTLNRWRRQATRRQRTAEGAWKARQQRQRCSWRETAAEAQQRCHSSDSQWLWPGQHAGGAHRQSCPCRGRQPQARFSKAPCVHEIHCHICSATLLKHADQHHSFHHLPRMALSPSTTQL